MWKTLTKYTASGLKKDLVLSVKLFGYVDLVRLDRLTGGPSRLIFFNFNLRRVWAELAGWYTKAQ